MSAFIWYVYISDTFGFSADIIVVPVFFDDASYMSDSAKYLGMHLDFSAQLETPISPEKKKKNRQFIRKRDNCIGWSEDVPD